MIFTSKRVFPNGDVRYSITRNNDRHILTFTRKQADDRHLIAQMIVRARKAIKNVK